MFVASLRRAWTRTGMPHPAREAADAPRQPPDARRRAGRVAIIILTAIFGTIGSIGMSAQIDRWDAHLADLRFAGLARDDLQTLNAGLTDSIDVVRSIRAFLQAFSRPISREEYQAFSSSLRARAVGLRDTAWAPHVLAADRAAFEAEIRASGWPDFQIVEFGADHKMVRAQDRAEYFPIIYSDPGPANRPVMGFDFLSEPVRSRTIGHARATNEPSVTPPIKLVNLDRPIGGLMSFVPVTQTDPAAGDADHATTGMVAGIFETAPMIENILATKLHLTDLELYVFDPHAADGNRLIYWHAPDGRPAPNEASLVASRHWQGILQLADQQWGVIFAPTSSFDTGANWTAAASLIGGLAMSWSITIYLWVMLKRTVQLEVLTANLRDTGDELLRNGMKLDYLARHDPLTGLANRTAFRDAVAGDLRRARRGHGLALLYLDLDRFKAVNDTLGHPAGDALLRAVAERLSHIVRDVDTVTRLGGDEFAIAEVDIEAPHMAETLARRVIETLSRPYEIDGQTVVVGVSIGITLANKDDQDADQLIRRADLALYSAKRNGCGTWRFFETSMEEQAQARRGLEMDLRNALERNEFAVLYQPMVTIATGAISGLEALLRWDHPERGLVMPEEFLTCAEETGLMGPIGNWVLHTALRDSARWPAGIRVTVHLSAFQLARDDLADIVEAGLVASGQGGGRLELEITENALIQNPLAGQATLKRLRSIGVQVSMDDFGTGYASLSHLRRTAFDRLKIDRSFIAGMTASPEGGAFVRAILQLATSLNIATTAEGVETREQLEQLGADGCGEAQGGLFSPPRPAAAIPSLLGLATAAAT